MNPWNYFARQRLVSIVLVGLLSFGGSWAVSLYRGIPIPVFHDEFSYLFSADSFAHGRVTNPTHPLWMFFETFGILQHPTYMSRYLPGQGLFLAAGQVIFGHPVFGVWLSAALMCSAICWMLYAWVPPGWALIGGIISVVQFGVFTYWSQSYWGGAAAALGGALVFGSCPRILIHQRIRDALWLGLGIAIILNTRPLEGILAIPVGCLLFKWKIDWKKIQTICFIRKILLPLTLFLLFTMMCMAFYNKKVTGNIFTLPYRLYTQTYSSVPLMIWQKVRPAVKLDNPVMEKFDNDRVRKYFLIKRTWKGFFEDIKKDSICNYEFYFGYPLTTAALFLALVLYLRRGMFFSLMMMIFFFLLSCAVAYCNSKPHYTAPMTCLVVFFMVEGLRLLAAFKLRKLRFGLIMVILFIIFQLGMNILHCPHDQATMSLAKAVSPPHNDLPYKFTREQLKNILIKRGGKYLVIVKYQPWHCYHWEWIYNDADIDRSSIVWARDLGADRNAQLLTYFKDRDVLYIEVMWDLIPGSIKKSEFYNSGQNGKRILGQLMKADIVQEVSPFGVVLNPDFNLKKEDVLRIAGGDGNSIWRLLQRHKDSENGDYRKINL